MDRNLIEWPAGDTGARVLGASPRRLGPFASLFMRSLSLLYGAGVGLRNRAFNAGILRAQRAHIPVISVGNIVAGGAGKTPFTRWLVSLLQERGLKVAILHGGYGADEPELHRRWLPSALVYEQRDRVRAVTKAAAAGAQVVVLDDAFQHRRLARDLDIVLIPAETKATGMLPFGPLRESQKSLVRSDLLVVTRKTASLANASELANGLRNTFDKPVAIAAIQSARIRPLSGPERTPPTDVFIVTAIARPDLLLESATAQVNVKRAFAYPDHYEFTERDVDYIVAAAAGLPILTTEKDAVKLSSLMNTRDVWVLDQTVQIEHGFDLIENRLAQLL